MWEHPAVMKVRAPAHEIVFVRLVPEFRDQPAQEEMLRETHARMRWHFKGAHFNEAQSAGAAFGGVEFVDAEFRTVRIAGGIDEQITEQSIHQPRQCFS